MKLVRRSALALVLFTSLAGIAPAWAAEEPPLVTALLKSWENQLKVKPTYQALTTESDGSIVFICSQLIALARRSISSKLEFPVEATFIAVLLLLLEPA